MKILDKNCIIDFNAFSQKFPAEASILKDCSGELSFEIREERLFYLDELSKGISINIPGELDYHRRYFHKNSVYKEPLAKALGIKKGISKPRVFDATGGMLKDSLLIYSFGAALTVTERNPLPAVLITNALSLDPLEDLEFKYQSAVDEVFDCDVAYYDPMYESKNTKASPKKEMRIFRELVGSDTDIEETANFLRENYKRLVIKRSIKAETVLDNPSIQFKGRSTRYDVYL